MLKFPKFQDILLTQKPRELSCSTYSSINFTSNQYLGLNPSQGSGGSRLLIDNTPYLAFEQWLADQMGTDTALIFGSGYQANLAFFSVFERNTLFLYDEYIHASIRDGIRLSSARSYSFKHNDTADIETLLSKHHERFDQIVILTETVFSMHGDQSPVQDIYAILDRFEDAYLVTDEAHSFGYQVSDTNTHKKHIARLLTFSKAIGMDGAAWLFYEDILLQVIVNTSRPFIYTTAPSVDYIETLKSRLGYLLDSKKEGVQLSENIAFYLRITTKSNFSKLNGPIQYYKAELKQLEKIQQYLAKNNIFIKIVQSPTVPLGQERIRFCLRADHTQEEIKYFIQLIQEAK